jgi:hypothetical protein
MIDPMRETKTARKWLWPVIATLFVIGALFWFAKPLGESQKVGITKPAVQSTEWAEEPEGPAVPVTLPTTPMMNAPIEDRDQSRGTGKEGE